MNLILLEKKEIASGRAKLTGRRFEHISSVLKPRQGDVLFAGVIGGKTGEARVASIDDASVTLECAFTHNPPRPLPLTLIMPMSRPPMFKRMLQAAASLGIKDIYVLNFNRTEKSLWNSSALADDAIHEQLVLGLEQGKDTVLPAVHLATRFRPFVEDKLPAIAKKTINIVAHPGGGPCPHAVKKPVTLVIGPEGGLVDFEVATFASAGFKSVDLGPRILRTENALPFLVGRLLP